ncbi:DUF5803 family protein [Haloarcula sp. GH36]|uniref:DUF5803 family protein n=1 Tax=Haloarcula montana TaxID=3111776 RepID=UPI002D77CC7B|nr:DUF5803 family protein [Haloarcula sp. GH36]
MNRRHLALVAVLATLALSGCTGLFGPEPSDPDRLNQNASYDWETPEDATIVVNRSSYTAVYDVENRSTFEVYTRDGLGRERSVPIRGLRFRYENGTVIEPANSSLSATEGSQRTEIQFGGNVSGEVAFSAPRSGKQFTTPTYVDGGSYAVTLPPNARVGIPLLSQVSPGNANTTVPPTSDRMTVSWGAVDAQMLSVRYYLQRDLLLFGGLTAGGIVVAIVGSVYYYRQLQAVKRRREEAGIDIEEDDDPRDRGPPPGMG